MESDEQRMKRWKLWNEGLVKYNIIIKLLNNNNKLLNNLFQKQTMDLYLVRVSELFLEKKFCAREKHLKPRKRKKIDSFVVILQESSSSGFN